MRAVREGNIPPIISKSSIVHVQLDEVREHNRFLLPGFGDISVERNPTPSNSVFVVRDLFTTLC